VGDGPLMRYSVELAKELGIFKNVIFSGFLAGEPLKDSFRNATMLVLPSITTRTGETEGLGMVLVEAISFGIPVIGSNIGGIPDIIIDGKTGLLFQPGNDVELAEKILLLIKNESLRRTLVEEGQKHVIENFSWDYIINKLETTILELTGKNSI
jgi:glycosyltransferase involved in cell wall biosynthesis